MQCFDCERYLAAQVAEIVNRVAQTPADSSVYIEFGGKAYDDQHAKRVLPGYDPDIKIKLLKELSGQFDVAVVVSARDILKPRIRGDTQLFYDREVIRLISNLRSASVDVGVGILSMVREDYSSDDMERLTRFVDAANSEIGMSFLSHGFITNYPSPTIFAQPSVFSRNPKIKLRNKNILVLSPGGGSGKFGVCLSQLFHDFKSGINSSYLKFETFPVFERPPSHPLNLAFMAATADLGNRVLEERAGGLTSYDKDMENFVLLKVLVEQFCPNPNGNPLASHENPSDMSVNKITSGFINEEQIELAAAREIVSRRNRYKDEVRRSIETEETIVHLEDNLPPELRHLLR